MIDTLLNKGVEEILPNRDFLKSSLLGKKKLTIYAGFDPTASTLHIGHSISLRKLRHFQDLGHKIIFLIGDFTGRIGDPTDKTSTRVQLSEKEIKQNLKLYKKQASKLIRFSGKNPAVVKFNNKWLGKLKFADILELGSLITVDQMLKRDMFVKRMEEGKPIYIHEFMYPLMQGYDSVAMDVDVEVGGNDQLFNMMTGRTLLKQIKNKEKVVLTLKLLTDSNGKKMGKTEGNMIALSDKPFDMYGKVMSWTDGMIASGFELCTDYTMSQVENVKKELSSGINPRDIKMRLAYEIVKVCFDDTTALKAEQSFISTFQNKEVSSSDIKNVKAKGRTLENVLVDENTVSSKSELRRLVESGAVTELETKKTIGVSEIKNRAEAGVYKIGKNRFIKISS